MSEKIYAFLLRLYPSRFRETYGDEALQLFRDRGLDERGFLASLRLWWDLLGDLAISIPREYGRVRPALIGASARQRLDGTPSFHFLEGESPHPAALVLGAVLSAVTVFAFTIPMRYAGNYQPLHALFARAQQAPGPESKPRNTPGAMTQAERQRVIAAVTANLKRYYIDSDLAQQMADALLAHEKSGDYNAVTDGAAFAGLLTRQLKDVSNDNHLIVVYSGLPIPDRQPGLSPEALARYQKAMEQENCTFEKVEILPHNIGYLKLNSFPEPSICQLTAKAAMASLNHADAIIFDLRDNGGGYPGMVMLMAAYLFDHPEYMYNPRENTTERSWTLSPVPGNRLADKPVYVLTSARTFSGAEHFSYDLKMLKRITLVGETTRGGAHAGSFHRIDDHFGMGIPETRAINPFSNTDWEGIGVEPDVKVKAADALATAEKLAENKLRKKPAVCETP